ncbi:MAG: MarC family protein [Paracoccaceae bacterium]|nr:MarC family protein [Paracoccaceae bacterium]
MTVSALITAFVTLFVIIEPIGIASVFLALTRGMTPARRRLVGRRACVVAIGILAAFGLFGQALLSFVGISIAAFRISGGILLFLTALDMLFERRTQRREGQVALEDDDHDPSVFPLAMPLLAGPGAMTTMILLMGRTGPGWMGPAALLATMAVVVGIAYLLFQMAGVLNRVLGRTGINVVTRLLGMLLAALSVQFVIDGVRAAGVLPG